MRARISSNVDAPETLLTEKQIFRPVTVESRQRLVGQPLAQLEMSQNMNAWCGSAWQLKDRPSTKP